MNAAQTRRLLTLAVIYEGGSRTQAAEIDGVSLQTVRDWGLLDAFEPNECQNYRNCGYELVEVESALGSLTISGEGVDA